MLRVASFRIVEPPIGFVHGLSGQRNGDLHVLARLLAPYGRLMTFPLRADTLLQAFKVPTRPCQHTPVRICAAPTDRGTSWGPPVRQDLSCQPRGMSSV